MNIYARVESGVVREIINPVMDESGAETPIVERFPSELVAQMIEIQDMSPKPDQGWLYQEGQFSAPPSNQESAAQIMASNEAKKAQLMAYASQVMTPLLVSLQLGNATDAEVLSAKEWQGYYRKLKEVEVTPELLSWPSAPENL
ncbi:tail fiber assembly protein [Pseudomonas syringae group sp. J309-1]|uniref:tail fiber assembly protein n=1 Tax=Pseudomonas syringae group sp. J309-1 TaxID=3079588 RepID=UPI00291403BF|nr:tail fiber assembly protein [Pseudomonas syringae group sp. J309-1]MDU8357969.1 tail fiber assembly protein [Pseudomonas syringae group sp. J309-1]